MIWQQGTGVNVLYAGAMKCICHIIQTSAYALLSNENGRVLLWYACKVSKVVWST